MAQYLPLTNKDLIRVSRSVGKDAYFRLGGALGLDEGLLKHLREASEKGCALNVLLLWRDERPKGENVRGALAAKLLEAGLAEQSDIITSGCPDSPSAYELPGDNFKANGTTTPTSPARFEYASKKTTLPGDKTFQTTQEEQSFTTSSLNQEAHSSPSHPQDPAQRSTDVQGSAKHHPEELEGCANGNIDASTVAGDNTRESPIDDNTKNKPHLEQSYPHANLTNFPAHSDGSQNVTATDYTTPLKPTALNPAAGNLFSLDDGSLGGSLGRNNVNNGSGVADTQAGAVGTISTVPIKEEVSPPTSLMSPDYSTIAECMMEADQSKRPSQPPRQEQHIADVLNNEEKTMGDVTSSAKYTDLANRPLPSSDTPAKPTRGISMDTRPPIPRPRLPSRDVSENVTPRGSLDASNATLLARQGMDPQGQSASFSRTSPKPAPRQAGETGPLASQPPQKRLGSSDQMGKQAPNITVQSGINEDVLAALAKDVESEGQVQALGHELGYQAEGIGRYQALNNEGGRSSANGTRQMLLDWRSMTAPEDQVLLLKHALRRTGLVKMADKHLKTAQRRRDIRSVKITKDFTVEGCRQKLEEHYKWDICSILARNDLMTTARLKTTIIVHQLVKRGKNIEVEKVVLEGTINDILKIRRDGILPYRIVILAAPGLGKTMAVAQIAYEWAHRVQGSPMQDIPLLFVLRMQYVNTHVSLGQAIIGQLLSGVKGVTSQVMDEFVEEHQAECMLVLDGLDAFKGDIFSSKSGHILRIAQNIQLKRCRVVVTGRPHVEEFFSQEDLPTSYAKTELRGLPEEESKSFINQFFTDRRRSEMLLEYLERNSVIQDLARMPLFCLLICHLWESNLLQVVSTQSGFFDNVNQFFLRHGEEKAAMVSADVDLDTIVQALGEVSLQGLLEDSTKHLFQTGDFKKVPDAFEKGCALGIISKTSPKKHGVVKDEPTIEFYNQAAQDHCAAKFMTKEVVKPGKGKHSKLDKALRQMERFNMSEFGNVLRFACGTGTAVVASQIVERILADCALDQGTKIRLLLDCFAEMTSLDGRMMLVAERCFGAGTVTLNHPSINTAAGFRKLPTSIKEKVKSVKILTSAMPKHVGESMAAGLGECPNILKFEVADAQNPAHPVILLLANKLSLHLSPEGSVAILPQLNQLVHDALRLVNISGCHLSDQAANALWVALQRCPVIDVMTVKDSAIASFSLPKLGCVRCVKVTLSPPVKGEDVAWLTSLLSDDESGTEVQVSFGSSARNTMRKSIKVIDEHVMIRDGTLELCKVTSNTIHVIGALPDTLKRTIKSLFIRHSKLTGELSSQLLAIAHSLIRLADFTTEGCLLSDEIEKLRVFKGSTQTPAKDRVEITPEGQLKGSVSSPLREEEFERLSRVLNRCTNLKEVDLTIGIPESDKRLALGHSALYQEYLQIAHGRMDLSKVSSASIEILKMLPGSFRLKINSVCLKHSSFTADLERPLWDILQGMSYLESFITENCLLPLKVPHLRSVCDIKLATLPPHCFDWEWLESAAYLEILDVTFSSLSAGTNPSGNGDFLDTMSSQAVRSKSAQEVGQVSSVVETDTEHLHVNLSHYRLVARHMSACSLSVMLHLPTHIKQKIQQIRIISTPLTVDLLNNLEDVFQSFRHLAPLSLEHLFRRPFRTECLLQPGGLHTVVWN